MTDLRLSVTPKLPVGYGKPTFVERFVVQGGTVKQSLFGTSGLAASKNDSVTIKIVNKDTLFTTHGLIFGDSRDGAIVQLFYGHHRLFYGLLDERQTKENVTKKELTIKALTADQMAKKAKVPSGIVSAGMPLIEVISIILQATAQVRLSVAVSSNLTLTSTDGIFGTSALEVCTDMANAMGAVLIFDGKQVKLRTLGGVIPRPHIINSKCIKEINNANEGTQYLKNSLIINDLLYTHAGSVSVYGEFSESLSMPYVAGQEPQVAKNILDFFAVNRKQYDIHLPLDASYQINLLDAIRIADDNFSEKPQSVYSFTCYNDKSTYKASNTIVGVFVVIAKIINLSQRIAVLTIREKHMNAGLHEGATQDDILLPPTYDNGLYGISRYS